METENERHRAIISSEIASLVQRDQDARKTGDASVTNLVDQRKKDIQAKKTERKNTDVLKDDFSSLRLEAHEQVDRETLARIRENPIPTEEEILVGAFREMIEPQVRDALFEFNRKGYSTESSGFYGAAGEMQCMDGYFDVDDETKAKIEVLGGQVLKGKDVGMPGQHARYTYIRFYPKHASREEIKATWDSIAALLPDRGAPAQPSISGGSEDFRNTYVKNRLDVEKAVLEKILSLDESDPETTRKMRDRLEELTK